MRPIRLNNEHVETLKAQVEAMLNMYNADENLTLKLDTSVVTTDIPKPIVALTTTAYVKMTYLIHNCNKELAWHGTVSKINNNYSISSYHNNTLTNISNSIIKKKKSFSMI